MRHNGDQHYTDTRNPDEILAEIERTRTEMDSTLNAIEHRLTPGQLVDQGMEYLKNSGGTEFVQNLATQAKYNPMPVALVGIGLAWLMASSKRPPSYGVYGTSTGPGLGERASGMAGSAKDKLSEGTHAMRERMHEGTQSMRERMSEGATAVRDRIRGAGESLSSMHQSTRQRMSDLGYSARHQMDRARDGVDYMIREQPLALGAIGLAIGAVMAAMAPRTRREDELLGETRDHLMDQAKQAGKEKLEQAKEVANSAVGAAKEQVSKQPSGAGSAGKPSGGSSASPSSGTPGAKPNVTSKPGQSSSGSGAGSTSIGNTGGSRNLP